MLGYQSFVNLLHLSKCHSLLTYDFEKSQGLSKKYLMLICLRQTMHFIYVIHHNFAHHINISMFMKNNLYHQRIE